MVGVISTSVVTIFFAICATSTFDSNTGLFTALFSSDTDNSRGCGRICIVNLVITTMMVLMCAFVNNFGTIYAASLVRKLVVVITVLAIPILTCTVLAFSADFDSTLTTGNIRRPTRFLGFFMGNSKAPISTISVVSGLT